MTGNFDYQLYVPVGREELYVYWTELQYCHHEFQCRNLKESNILQPP